MALLSSWLTVNRHRRFTYLPRYYDARKERHEEFIRQLENGEQTDIDNTIRSRPGIQRGFLNTMRKKRREEKNTSFLRLIVILLALVIIFYLLLR